jgi:hypothetical protein
MPKPFLKGHTPWNKGKKGLQKGKRNSGSFKKGNRLWDNPNNEKTRFKSGKECLGWQGGLSCEKYPVEWKETLRRSIRERDNYICQICNKQQGDKAHDVHHIDYNKKNCNPENLITLCVVCHAKTSYHRDYWKDYFKRSAENKQLAVK